MNVLPTFKRGESFALGFEYKSPDGEPVNLTTITIKSQIRSQSNALVKELLVTKLDQTQHCGQASLYVQTAEETKIWPTGLLVCDVKLSIGNQSILTETFRIPVAAGVTE